MQILSFTFRLLVYIVVMIMCVFYICRDNSMPIHVYTQSTLNVRYVCTAEIHMFACTL